MDDLVKSYLVTLKAMVIAVGSFAVMLEILSISDGALVAFVCGVIFLITILVVVAYLVFFRNKRDEKEIAEDEIIVSKETAVDKNPTIFQQIKTCRNHMHDYTGIFENEMIQMSQQLKKIKKLLLFLFDCCDKEPDVEEKLQKLYSYYLPTLESLIDITNTIKIGTSPDIQTLIQGYKDIQLVLEVYKQNLLQSENLNLYAEVKTLETMAAYDGLNNANKINNTNKSH